MVVSKATRAYLIATEHVPADGIAQVYLGFDFDRLEAIARGGSALRAELGLRERFVVGTVGRLSPTKGHKYLIAAADLLRETIPNLSLMFVGAGSTETLEELVHAQGLDGNVLILGHRDDVPACLSAADVVAHPTLSEGFGQVLAEALAVGRPVVASDVGGTSEIVKNGQTGLLVPAAEPDALATAIRTLYEDQPLRERLGAAGQQDVRRRFTIERMIDGHVSSYLDWLSGG
jgi:glycosyltransferase involved in cell wall biosynthesis